MVARGSQESVRTDLGRWGLRAVGQLRIDGDLTSLCEDTKCQSRELCWNYRNTSLAKPEELFTVLVITSQGHTHSPTLEGGIPTLFFILLLHGIWN